MQAMLTKNLCLPYGTHCTLSAVLGTAARHRFGAEVRPGGSRVSHHSSLKARSLAKGGMPRIAMSYG